MESSAHSNGSTIAALFGSRRNDGDLYNHDLYSRDVAEKAIRKYNNDIERCNRAIEAGQHGLALAGGRLGSRAMQ